MKATAAGSPPIMSNYSSDLDGQSQSPNLM
jgi:hypothetical protein